MKKLACKAVTGLECPHTVSGPVTDDVVHNMWEHILAEHPEITKDLDDAGKKAFLDKMHSLVEIS